MTGDYRAGHHQGFEAEGLLFSPGRIGQGYQY
jgi:hypothetical protein